MPAREKRELPRRKSSGASISTSKAATFVRQPTKPLGPPAHPPRHRRVGLARFQAADLEGEILAGTLGR